MIKRGIRGLLLAACVVAGAGWAAENERPVDPVWGDYAELAGRTARAGTQGYRLRWYWAVPGKELVQEYRNPGDDSVAHREVIKPGAQPGTLVLQSSALGKKQWNGTLQPDGRVLFIGKGLLKLPYVAGESDDGTWQIRQVELDDGRVASESAPTKYNRFVFEDADTTPALAGAASPPVPRAPVAAAAPATPRPGQADAPASLPVSTIQNGTFDPQGLDGALSTMLVLALAQEGDRIRANFDSSRHEYRRVADGTFQKVGESTHGLRIIDAQTVELTGTANGGTSRRYLRRHGAGAQPHELRYGTYSIVGQDPRTPLKVLRLAGNTINFAEPMGVSDFVRKADGRYYDPSTNATLRIIDLYTVEWAPPAGQPGNRLFLTRVGDARPDYVEVSRRKLDQWMAGYEASQAPVRAAEEAEWQAHLDSVDNMTPNGTGVANVMDGFMRGLTEGTAKNHAMQQSMQDARDRGLAEGALEYTRREAERARQEAGQRQADVEHARRVREQEEAAQQARLATQAAQAQRPARVEQESQQAGTGKPGGAAAPAAVKPLRFVLMIGMRNLPGDRNNSVCYSNVITRPGPPGWGAPGFLPSGSGEQALQQINSMKDEFIAACRRKGREITSEGNFSYRWNQSDRDEQEVQAAKPRVPEDLSVVLN